MKKIQYPGDAVIYVTVVFLMLLSIAAPRLFSGRDAPQYVVVTYDGCTASYPLSQDTILPITTEAGHTLTVCIQGGTVSVTDASCPDRICERTAPIHRPGSAIACVPSGVLIEITGKGGDDDADIILG